MELFTVTFAGQVFILTFFESMSPTMSVQYYETQISQSPTSIKTQYLGNTRCKSSKEGEGKYVCRATIDGKKIAFIYSQDLAGAVQVSIE